LTRQSDISRIGCRATHFNYFQYEGLAVRRPRHHCFNAFREESVRRRQRRTAHLKTGASENKRI